MEWTVAKGQAKIDSSELSFGQVLIKPLPALRLWKVKRKGWWKFFFIGLKNICFSYEKGLIIEEMKLNCVSFLSWSGKFFR